MTEEGSIRKRGKLSNDFTSYGSSGELIANGGIHQNWKFPATKCLAGLAVSFLLMIGITALAESRLPTPVMLNEAHTRPGTFVGERAYKHLERLTSIGPRVAGSYENEVRAVDLLLREIGFIKQFAHSAHKITMDVQRASGVMTPDTKGQAENTIYHSLVNIVVKIEAARNSSLVDEVGQSLLVNAHFDSVYGSPGASDNGVSVAVALEVLEVISRSKEATKRPVIFLFNGAEEKGMLGAHGFITKHAWAKSVGAFVNLDACGAGGREIVFQSGPGNSWLIKAYAAAAPHPFANIIGQEIFDARLIPSETDFKIFRDFGHIPGLDLAYFTNGYVYHTKYDDLQQISLGTVQRAGENLLALVLKLAQSEWPSDRDPSDTIIFFDYLGLFMVSFSNMTWHLLNIVLIGLAFYQSIQWVATQDSGVSGQMGGVCKQVIFSCLAGLIQILGAFFVTWLVVMLVSLTGQTMSWFSRPSLILMSIYGLPALSAVLFIALQVSDAQQRVLKSTLLVERVQFEGVKLNLTIIVLLSYMYGLRSNVLLLPWLSSAILGRWIIDYLYRRKQIDGVWLILNFLSFSVPVLQTLYLGDSVIALLVPVSGRSGSSANPDLLIAMVTVALALLVTLFIFPLINLVRHARKLLGLLIICHLIAAFAVMVTPLGFPYSAPGPDSIGARVQRVQILHVERTFYESNDRVGRRESGYWLFAWDRHIGPESLAPLGPSGSVELVSETECHALPYCGLPYYFPSLKRVRTSYWTAAPQPLIYHPPRLRLIDQAITGINLRSLTFELTGPDHMALMIWPVAGVELVGWSANPNLPHVDPFYAGTVRPLYFVTYFYGVQPTAPYQLTVTLKVPPSLNGNKPVVEMAVTSHIQHGHDQMTNEFTNALKTKFPAWVYAYGWTATYSHWSF